MLNSCGLQRALDALPCFMWPTCGACNSCGPHAVHAIHVARVRCMQFMWPTCGACTDKHQSSLGAQFDTPSLPPPPSIELTGKGWSRAEAALAAFLPPGAALAAMPPAPMLRVARASVCREVCAKDPHAGVQLVAVLQVRVAGG